MLKGLPPEPKLRFDSDIIALLNSAENSIRQLEGAISLFPHDHYIIKLLAANEAIESLKIDGYPFSLLNFFDSICYEDKNSIGLINQNVSSLSLGFRLVKNVSHSSHIIKSVYKELLRPEENLSENIFRDLEINIKQNSDGSVYIPPKPEKISQLMSDLEKYISSDISYPPLINAALVHAQFEMIHPFTSFNGLVGRILFQIHLYWKKYLLHGALQLSDSLNKNKSAYFACIEEIEKNNNWLNWIRFFLKIVSDASGYTRSLIQKILDWERVALSKISSASLASPSIIKVFSYIFNQPVITLPHITKELLLTKQTANVAVAKLKEADIIEEVTGKQRNRIYYNKNLITLFN
jgi:Fic family protein